MAVTARVRKRADAVVDYTHEDIGDIGDAGRSYDVVFDAVGKLSTSDAKRVLSKGGAFVSVKGSAKLYPDDLDKLSALIDAGKLRAVIDRRFPLAEVATAHAYVESGRKKGNVVISVADLG